jgi:addiction module RelE/StbE family toxin
MKYSVDFSDVEHLLSNPKKLPHSIRRAVVAWANQVEKLGLQSVLTMASYNIHALRGPWDGSYSVKLNYKWRLIYRLSGNELNIVKVERISPHDYRKI